MGRNCGYLALCTAIACSADFVFIPESPPENGWEEKMCEKLKASRAFGNRLNIIIVAEGATDSEGKSITTAYVKNICEKHLDMDTRVGCGPGRI